MELDQVEVLEVIPATVPAGTHPGSWRCSSCSSPYPVGEGFKVLYDTIPGLRTVAYVCRACAEAVAVRPA